MSSMAAAGSKSWLLERRSNSERRPALSIHQSRDYKVERERGFVNKWHIISMRKHIIQQNAVYITNT